MNAIIAEYVLNLSDDNLRFLALRLSEQVGSDLADALHFLSHNQKLDALLTAADTAVDLYDLTDEICDGLLKECDRRQIELYEFAEI